MGDQMNSQSRVFTKGGRGTGRKSRNSNFERSNRGDNQNKSVGGYNTNNKQGSSGNNREIETVPQVSDDVKRLSLDEAPESCAAPRLNPDAPPFEFNFGLTTDAVVYKHTEVTVKEPKVDAIDEIDFWESRIDSTSDHTCKELSNDLNNDSISASFERSQGNTDRGSRPPLRVSGRVDDYSKKKKHKKGSDRFDVRADDRRSNIPFENNPTTNNPGYESSFENNQGNTPSDLRPLSGISGRIDNYRKGSDQSVHSMNTKDFNWRVENVQNSDPSWDDVTPPENPGWKKEDRKSGGELNAYWNNNPKNFKKNDSGRSEKEQVSGQPRRTKPTRWDNQNVNVQNYEVVKKCDKFEEYEDQYRFNKKIKFQRVIEVDGDLFTAGKEYALANCVAEDMNMGSGIAVTFRREFKGLDELMNQKAKQGGVAWLECEGRHVYYLVTKRMSSGKPTLETMFRSTNALKELMTAHEVKKLAIPRLGCGLDRLEWSEVKAMLEFVFLDTEIEIKVFNFQQASVEMEKQNANHHHRICKIFTETTSIKDFNKQYTLVLFFGSECGADSPQMREIDDRFCFLREYKQMDKSLGSYTINYKYNGYYAITGLIVRKNQRDPFDFKAFQQAVTTLNKDNQKAEKTNEKYPHVAIHMYYDPTDSVFMNKINNVLRNTFYDVTVHVILTNPGS